MKLGFIHKVNGELVVCTRQNKKAFLQVISDMIDDCEADGAKVFDLLLNTDLYDNKKEN